MKKLGILLALLTFATVIFGMSASVYAATNTDVINTLKAANVDAVYVTKADNYLKSANLTSAQLDTINSDVQKVADLLKANNTTDVTTLSKADKNTVMNYIKDAAQTANLTATFGKDSSGHSYVSLTDSTGAEVFHLSANDKGLRVTGANYWVMIYGGALLVLAGGLLLALRKRNTAVVALTA